MLVALMTGMGIKRRCICTGENDRFGTMKYWGLKHDSCTTHTLQFMFVSQWCTYWTNSWEKTQQHFRYLLKFLTLGNEPYAWHYITDNLHGREYQQGYSDPLQLARWGLNSSMGLDIFMYEGQEFHKDPHPPTPTPINTLHFAVWIPYLSVLILGDAVILQLVNCT